MTSKTNFVRQQIDSIIARSNETSYFCLAFLSQSWRDFFKNQDEEETERETKLIRKEKRERDDQNYFIFPFHFSVFRRERAAAQFFYYFSRHHFAFEFIRQFRRILWTWFYKISRDSFPINIFFFLTLDLVLLRSSEKQSCLSYFHSLRFQLRPTFASREWLWITIPLFFSSKLPSNSNWNFLHTFFLEISHSNERCSSELE